MLVSPVHGQISRCRELLTQNSSSLVLLGDAAKYFRIFKYKTKQLHHQLTFVYRISQTQTDKVQIKQNQFFCRNHQLQWKMNRHIEMREIEMGSLL